MTSYSNVSGSFEAVSFLQYDELIQKLRDNPEQNWVDLDLFMELS